MVEAAKKNTSEQEPFQAILNRLGQEGPAKPSTTPVAANHPHDKIFISPLARRIAEQEGVDISKVTGTGPNGRIILADVESYIANNKSALTRKVDEIATSLASMVEEKSERRKVDFEPVVSGAVSARLETVEPVREEKDEIVEAMVEIETIIRTNQNKRDETFVREKDECKTLVANTPNAGVVPYQTPTINGVPYYHMSLDVEVEELLKLREAMNTTHSRAVSLRDFAVRAMALALKKLPSLNAVWFAGEATKQSSIAVAVASADGIDCVIDHADSKSVMDIASASFAEEEAENLQDVALVVDFGRYGVKECRGIAFGSHTLVLSLGVYEQRVVVRKGLPTVAYMMTCWLSADQRVVDGITGAAFLATLKDAFEHPYTLIV